MSKEANHRPQPLVFISHDTRDAELAEAFSKLLKSVSAGLLKSFRSSDRQGTEGIEYGDEWYKRLMSNLESASDVVCLFTERSLDRPWILYEAGVAKGKLDAKVHGIALGISLSEVSTGPFYQFQNSDDSQESLSGLVTQLARRIPGLEPDPEVVKGQVDQFRERVQQFLSTSAPSKEREKSKRFSGADAAKVFEEIKVMVRDLPARLEDNLSEGTFQRRRRWRRFHPKMLDEILYRADKEDDGSLGILILASFLREDFPWLYELAMEVYRAARTGRIKDAEIAAMRLRRVAKSTSRGPLMEMLGPLHKELHMIVMEIPHLIDNQLRGYLKRFDEEEEPGADYHS